MCGRYLRRADKQRLTEAIRLGHRPEEIPLPPDYNIAPATFQPVIRLNRDTLEREMVLMRWGLVPYFAKSLADWKGFSTINAKAETVQERALWRGPFEKRRCLVPADGRDGSKHLKTKVLQCALPEVASCAVPHFFDQVCSSSLAHCMCSPLRER